MGFFAREYNPDFLATKTYVSIHLLGSHETIMQVNVMVSVNQASHQKHNNIFLAAVKTITLHA